MSRQRGGSALLGRTALLVSLALPAWAQPRDPEGAELALFEERVQVSVAGRALDVDFRNTDIAVHPMDEIVWIADPTTTGIVGVASRPIFGTAKAGELMGRRAPELLRNTAAVAVTPRGVYAMSESGRLTVLGEHSADSLDVGQTLATAIDVDANSNGLIFVLWGSRVDVFTTPPQSPLWSFEVDDDLKPAVALAASAAGEVFVAGRGTRALCVYELGASGQYERTRYVDAGSLELESAGGVVVTPFMLVPVEGREGWVDRDRFVLLSDSATGALIALERTDLGFVGRWDVRQNNPAAAPGRLATSNRGQIAYVDQRSAEAWVLPTAVMAALIGGADLRWRILDRQRQFRVQGGDTLRIR